MFPSARGLAATVVVLIALVFHGGAVRAYAQTGTTGSLNIVVVDATGAAVPEAVLELKDLTTNDVRKSVTQQNGAFTFPDLPFGNYQLVITAKGFQRQVFESIQVQTGRMTALQPTLKIGGATETVSVAANATPLVESTSTVLATTIDTKQVTSISFH
jgi:hypothetical protein